MNLEKHFIFAFSDSESYNFKDNQIPIFHSQKVTKIHKIMAKQWFKTKCDTKSMMNNLEQQYECQICKTKFDRPQTLNKHMLECNPPKTYTFRSSRQKSKKSNCNSKNCFKLDCDNKC